MNIKFLLLSVFLPCSLLAQEPKWTIEMQHGKNESLTFEPLSSVYFSDSLHGWIGANNGVIKTTDNGGISWQDIQTPAEEIITAIYMLDKNTAWVMADHYPISQMYRTTDAGKTWETITFELEQVWSIRDLRFVDINTGYFISRGRLFATNDGGYNWNKVSVEDVFATGYCFVDRMNGWLLHRTGAMRTADEGKTWIPVRNLTIKKNEMEFPYWNEGYYCDISFTDVNNGIISASMIDTFGYLLTTSDGGNTWTKKEIPNIPTFSINAFPEELSSQPEQFLGHVSIQHIDKHNVVVRSYSQIFLTTHQLDHFQPINTDPFPIQISYDLHFLTKDKWVSSSSLGISHTINGGQTWECSRELPLPTLMDVYFTDSKNGYAVGGKGSMLRTMNGGEIWRTVQIPTKNDLMKVFFYSPIHGWVSSNKGELFHTIDGGSTWETLQLQQDIPDQFADRSLQKHITHKYPDLKYPVNFTHRVKMVRNTSWIMGTKEDPISRNSSTIFYQTTYGGANWKEINPNGTFTFSDFLPDDSMTAYAVDIQSIYKTVDGGINWEKLPLHTSNIRIISIFRTSLGQLMLQTTKGMANYDPVSGIVEEKPHLLTHSNLGDAYKSFCYTINGQQAWWLMPDMMYETTNGGSTWEQLLPDGYLQNGIHSFSVQGKHIWVVGGNGVILKLTNTQPTEEEQFQRNIQDKVENFRNLFNR